MALEDYKDIVATCAAISTMGHMLSGTLICKDIHRKGTAKDFDPMPFVGGIGMCILMLRYAWILQDSTMINVNIFGLLTNTIYMAVYYYYIPYTRDILALLYKAIVFVTGFLIYAQLEDPEKVEYRFGIIVTILFLFLVGSPLIHLRKIIKTKNTDILPFPLIFMGTIVSFQWLLYGLIINNSFIIFQNAVAFVLSVAQMSLFLIYPHTSVNVTVQQKKED